MVKRNKGLYTVLTYFLTLIKYWVCFNINVGVINIKIHYFKN